MIPVYCVYDFAYFHVLFSLAYMNSERHMCACAGLKINILVAEKSCKNAVFIVNSLCRTDGIIVTSVKLLCYL